MKKKQKKKYFKNINSRQDEKKKYRKCLLSELNIYEHIVCNVGECAMKRVSLCYDTM